MPPIGPPGRLPLSVCLCALGALNLTCARPIAAGATTAGAPAAAAAGSVRDDEPIAPMADASRSRCPRPSTPSCVRSARRSHATSSAASRRWWCPPPNTCVARGIASRRGRRGAHPGRRRYPQAVVGLVRQPADPRRRRQRRERGERAGRAPAAARARRAPDRARLPAPGVQRDARAFSLCAARCRAARDQSARAAHWADAFARHVGGSAWGEFATARVRQLYPEAAPKAVAARRPIPRGRGRGRSNEGAGKGKERGSGRQAGAGAARPRA